MGSREVGRGDSGPGDVGRADAVGPLRALLTMPSLVRRLVELLASAAFAIGVYEFVVAGALALWPDITDSWILLLWMTAATIAGLGMSQVRRLVDAALRRVWPATAGPSHALVAMTAAGAVAASAEQVGTGVAALLAAGTGARRAQVWLAEADGRLRRVGRWPAAPGAAAPAGPSLAALSEPSAGDYVEPVSDADGTLGALVLGARSGRGAIGLDRRLIAEAAGAVALLLRNLRLTSELELALSREHEQERRLGLSRHRVITARDVARARLSGEIQSRIGPALAACAVEVDALLADPDHHPADPTLATMTERINVAITDFRQIVHGFYPAVLTDHGLASSLDNLVSELPWPATCEATALPRFDRRVEMGVYFCLAAIVGSLRDTRADADPLSPVRRLDLRALLDNDTFPPMLTATVVVHADAAISFDADTIDPDTIDAIDDRVGALDGQLGIESDPSGLRLTLSVPISAADPATGTPS